MEFRTDRYKLKDIFPQKAGKYAQKLHKKADQIDFVRKMIPVDSQDITVKDGERAVIRLITTPHTDRDSDILIPHGAILDDFRASPSVLFGHDYRSLPVAKDLWLKVTEKGILAKSQYAKHAFAQDVYECIKGGFLNSNSVGFIPVDGVNAEDDPKEFAKWQDALEKDYGIAKEESQKAKMIYTRWILLEHSDVPIASNAQSLNLAFEKGDLPIQSEKFKQEFKLGNEDFDEPDNLDEELVGDMALKKILEAEDLPETTVSTESAVSTNVETDTKSETVTKPETTDNYHRIPVSEGHDDHRIKTIAVSAKQGIKALYCGTCKKIITYLFDVEKWTMAEAQAWVKEHEKAVCRLVEMKLLQEAEESEFFEYGEVVEVDDIFQRVPTGIEPWEGEDLELVESGDVDEINMADAEIEIVAEVAEVTEKDDEESADEDIELEEIEITEDIEAESKVSEDKAGEDNLVPEETITCECIKCGHKTMLEPGKHCSDLECEKCGGKMRRADRPGPGKIFEDAEDTEDQEYLFRVGDIEAEVELEETEHEPDDRADLKEALTIIKELKAEVAEIKEGRVLSSKNRTLIKSVISSIEDALPELKTLLDATDPAREEEKDYIEIEDTDDSEGGVETKTENAEDGDDQNIDAIAEALATLLKSDDIKTLIAEATREAARVEIARIRGKVLTEDE